MKRHARRKGKEKQKGNERQEESRNREVKRKKLCSFFGSMEWKRCQSWHDGNRIGISRGWKTETSGGCEIMESLLPPSPLHEG